MVYVIVDLYAKKKNQLKLSSELTVKQRSFVDILCKAIGVRFPRLKLLNKLATNQNKNMDQEILPQD